MWWSAYTSVFSPSECRSSTQRTSGGLVRSNGRRDSAAITSSACPAGTSSTRSGAVTPATTRCVATPSAVTNAVRKISCLRTISSSAARSTVVSTSPCSDTVA